MGKKARVEGQLRWPTRYYEILWSVLAAAAVSRLIYKAWIGSTDFSVYWKAIHAWVSSSTSPYFYTAETQGFVFKYPPWILPVFLPFAFLSFDVSKIIWAVLELCCVGYAIAWVRRRQVSRPVAYLSALSLWWIWQDHFWSGQITLGLLAMALWAVDSDDDAPVNHMKTSLLGIVFTAKIFSVLTLAGVLRRFLRVRVWATMLGMMGLATVVVWGVMIWHGSAETLAGLYSEWFRAAASGGSELGAHVVRGQLNHGLTAGVLRWLGVGATEVHGDILVCFALFGVLGTIWTRVSRTLTETERWSGWIALGLIVHPLAWDHSFVMAYPLGALALDRAIRSSKLALIALGVLGLGCVGILIPNVIGTEAVKPLEYLAVKSWGVIFSASALVMARRIISQNRPAKRALD